jgi:hypothetical protein
MFTRSVAATVVVGFMAVEEALTVVAVSMVEEAFMVEVVSIVVAAFMAPLAYVPAAASDPVALLHVARLAFAVEL